jgi:hypothetical protein
MRQVTCCFSRRFASRAVFASLLLAMTVASLRADDISPLIPTGTSFSQPAGVLVLVTNPAIRDDLKLTEDQQRQIQELSDSLPKTNPAADPSTGRVNLQQLAEEAQRVQEALFDLLTPAQVRRHLQLTLQHMLVTAGLTTVVQIPEIAEVLQIDESQWQQIVEAAKEQQMAVNQTLSGIAGNRNTQPARLFANPDLMAAEMRGMLQMPQMSELAEQFHDQLSGILTDSQKKRLAEALAPPLHAPLPIMQISLNLAAARNAGGGRGAPGIAGGRRPGAFPNVIGSRAPRPAPDRWNGLGRISINQYPTGLGLLALEQVQQELKLSAEKVQQYIPLGGDPVELQQAAGQLDQWLTPVQLARYRQLVLQLLIRRNGPAALFEFHDAMQSLQLTSSQRTTLADLARADRFSTRHSVAQAIERDPRKLAAEEQPVLDRMLAVLTESQRKELTGLIGEPFAGSLSSAAVERALEPRRSMRARTAVSLGFVTAVPVHYLMQPPIRNDLKLTAEQQAAIPEARSLGRGGRGGIAAGAVPNVPVNSGQPLDNKALELLTAEQRQRYHAILLQGLALTEGPATLFRYKLVIDVLSPTETQQQEILKIVQDDTRGYLRIPIADLADGQLALDEKTAARLDAVLTANQRDKLAQLLGEPADYLEEPQSPVPNAIAAPPAPAPGAAPEPAPGPARGARGKK